MKLILTVLISIVCWNVENCFDYMDGGLSGSDAEFSSRGARHWTKARLQAKTEMIGKTLLWSGKPAIVGLCEVENDFVLRRIIGSDILRKCRYGYVHYDSPDPRGIDVALLYCKDSVRTLESRPIKVKGFRTRDILYVKLLHLESGEIWHLFVNHHPSKYGGGTSGGRRVTAMKALLHSVDSLIAAGQGRIVAMGDFNDTPDGEAFARAEGSLCNLGREVKEGSIRYHGNWQLIDNFLVSEDLAGKVTMEVLSPPFLMERDRQWPGEKPKRTFVGPRYNGGVSDHLPIRLLSHPRSEAPEGITSVDR